ncbi:hypothetical protein H7I42_08230, partial [Mycolicibacterium vanbaalenii PYR-1]|nr:hypothetical protein [Mycolicibacterium vanbaalenii PYR-1]
TDRTDGHDGGVGYDITDRTDGRDITNPGRDYDGGGGEGVGRARCRTRWRRSGRW